jgi:P-type Ca2+ transporter type 2C
MEEEKGPGHGGESGVWDTTDPGEQQHGEVARSSNDTPEWHLMNINQVMDILQSNFQGLTQEEVALRVEKYGFNILPERPGPSCLDHLWEQVNSPLIYVLLVGAVLSFGFHHLIDGIVILIVIVINISLGLFMEGRAESTTKNLTKMLSQSATVLRDDQRVIIDTKELTLGDIFSLQAGDIVPADGRILCSFDLSITESSLTGEAEPIQKEKERCNGHDVPLAERYCMVYSGTQVMKGSATCVTTSIGKECEIGKIQTLLETVESPKTPLVLELERLGLKLAIVIAVVAILALGVAFARQYSPEESFSFAIGVAVAAIPEGLPSCVTITFAVGVRAMAFERAIVKSLPAAETLGSVSVICSDKTGTLTMNEMTVQMIGTQDNCFQVGQSEQRYLKNLLGSFRS